MSNMLLSQQSQEKTEREQGKSAGSSGAHIPLLSQCQPQAKGAGLALFQSGIDYSHLCEDLHLWAVCAQVNAAPVAQRRFSEKDCWCQPLKLKHKKGGRQVHRTSKKCPRASGWSNYHVHGNSSCIIHCADFLVNLYYNLVRWGNCLHFIGTNSF